MLFIFVVFVLLAYTKQTKLWKMWPWVVINRNYLHAAAVVVGVGILIALHAAQLTALRLLVWTYLNLLLANFDAFWDVAA